MSQRSRSKPLVKRLRRTPERNPKRYRRLQLEHLEQRTVLAFAPEAWATLSQGLNDTLLPWLDAVQDSGNLSKPLPLLNRSFADILPVSDVLKSVLVAPAQKYITEHPNADFSDFINWLPQIAGVRLPGLTIESVSATGGMAGQIAQVDLRLSLKEIEASQPMAITSEAEKITLNLDANDDIELRTTATLDFSFGVDLATSTFFLAADGPDAEIAVRTAIYSKVPPRPGQGDGTFPLVGSLVGNIGFVDVTAPGTVGIVASASSNWGDANGSFQLRANSDAYRSAIFEPASVSTETLTGSARYAGDLNARQSSVFPIFSSLGVNLTLGDQGISQTSQGTNVERFAEYSQINPLAFSKGLDQATAFLARAATEALPDTNPMAEVVPLLQQSLASAIGLQDLLRSSLTNRTTITNEGRLPFTDDMGLKGILAKIPAATVTGPIYSANDVRYTLHIDRNVDVTVPLNLQIPGTLDLLTDRTTTFRFDTDLDLQFGVRASDGMFFLVDGSSPEFRASLSVPNANLFGPGQAARLGFTDVTLSGGAITSTAAVEIRLKDSNVDDRPIASPNVQTIYRVEDVPSSPGLITATELMGETAEPGLPTPNRYANLVEFATPGTAMSASVGIAGQVNGTGGFSESGTLSLSWPNVFSDNSAVVDTTQIPKLAKFQSIRASEVKAALQELPRIAQAMEGVQGLGTTLPLVGSSLIPQLRLDEPLRSAISGLGEFHTIQQLQSHLAASLNQNGSAGTADIIVNNDAVQIKLGVSQALTNGTVPLSIDEPLATQSGLAFQATGNLPVNATASASLAFGMQFDPADTLSPESQFFLDPALSGAELRLAANAGASSPLTTRVTLGTKALTGTTTASLSLAGSAPSVRASLKDPAAPGTSEDDQRISFAEFRTRPAAMFQAPLVAGTAVAETTLPGSGNSPGPWVRVEWANLAAAPAVTTGDLSGYSQAANSYDQGPIQQGVDSILGLLDHWATLPELNQKLPVLDKSLLELVPFVEQLKSAFRSIVASTLTSAQQFHDAVLRAANGIPGLSIIADPNSNAAEHNLAATRFRYRVVYDLPLTTALQLNFGVDALQGVIPQILSSTNVHVEFDFGINPSNGFFIARRSGNSPEFSLVTQGTVTLSDGTFGPIHIDPQGQAAIHVDIHADLVNPARPSASIAASTLVGNLAGVVRPVMAAQADLDFEIQSTIGEDGPGISTGFDAHWNLARPADITYGPNGSTDARDGFHGIEYSLGDVLDKSLGSFLRDVNRYNPIPAEVSEFLTTPLPLPIVEITPLDAILAVTGLPKEVALLFQISAIVNEVSCVVNGGSGCSGDTRGSGEGPGGSNDSDLRRFLDKVEKNYDVSSPFLDDIEGSVKDIFLGKTVTLIQWDPAAFDVPISFNSPSIPFMAVGPVVLAYHYGTKFGLKGDFGVGLSTLGLQTTGKLMDGFFISDNIAGSSDPNEFEVYGQITVGVSASLLGIVGIYGDGGIQITIGADMADLTAPPELSLIGRCDEGGDGRVHLSELRFINDTFGPASLANLNADVSAVIDIGVELLSFIRVTVLEADLTLLETGDACESFDPQPVRFVQTVGDTTIASLHTLFDSVPEPGDDQDRKFEILVTRGADNQPDGVDFRVRTRKGIYVDHRSLQELGGTKNLLIRGSVGPDRIILDPDLTLILPIEFIDVSSEGGNDFIDLGQIAPEKVGESHLIHTRIDSGTDDDRIRASFADDYIVGGYGADRIYAGDGANRIFGDLETTSYTGDTTFFFSGKDYITSGSGNDTIEGGWGNDNISAGNGDNLVFGGPGNDSIATGDGSDTVYAGLVEDDAHPLSGANAIVDAGGEENRLYGAFGNDVILASKTSGLRASNLIRGGMGNDRIESYGGDNRVFGGAGNDEVRTSDGHDWIWGDTGNDLIIAGDGDNRVWGGSGDDKITSGAGRDELHGDENADTINAGDSADIVWGGSGADTIVGGDGADILYGESGADSLQGGSGDDLLDAGSESGNSIDGGPHFDVVVQAPAPVQRLDDHYLSGIGETAHVNVEHFRLQGTYAGEQFIIGHFTHTAQIDGDGGTDLINITHDADFTLSDWNLTNSDGGSILLRSIESATLQGGPSDNRFDVSRWSGSGVLAGAGGKDTLVSSRDTDFLLTNTSFSQTADNSFSIQAMEAAELTGGISANVIDASAFSGECTLIGGEGDDTIRGGSQADLIDGGFGADLLYGGGGDDRILAGPGAGGYIDGGAGDDDLQGADDGADTILGSFGDDYITGGGGNDDLRGGQGADVIHGGEGDDQITGDENEDILFGDAGNDVLYAFRASPSGGPGTVDHSINYLYGDLGTDNDEPSSGNDDLYGAQGNDFLFGEGGDDRIQGGGSGVHAAYGSGEGPAPGDLGPFVVTPPPVPLSAPGRLVAAATLPAGLDERGRWTQFANSAIRSGLSGDPGLSFEASIAAGADGQYVAWSDNRSGYFQIYVARHDGSGWHELTGSASNGGISDSLSNSRQPSIALDASGQPLVVWLGISAGLPVVRAARYAPQANGGNGVWESLGDISVPGAVDQPRVVSTSSGPVVAWLRDEGGGIANVHVKRFNGTSWEEMGNESATGRGISLASTGVSGMTMTTDGTRVAIAWSQVASGAQNIFLKQFANGIWTGVGESSSGTGISGSSGASNHLNPTVAYLNGQLFAAWEEQVGDSIALRAMRNTGVIWTAVDVGDRSFPDGSSSTHVSRHPQLATGGQRLHLLWTEDRIAGKTGNSNAIYARVWNGSTFADEIPIDSTGGGISGIANPQAISVSVDAAGHPFVAWTDWSSGTPEVYVRGNTFDLGQVYFVNDNSTAGDAFTTAAGSSGNNGKSAAAPRLTVQAVLDSYDLNPGDVILIDSGKYAAGFEVRAGDSGVLIQGANQLSDTTIDRIALTDSSDVVVRDLRTSGATLTNANDVSLYDLVFSNPTNPLSVPDVGISIHGGSGAHLSNLNFESEYVGRVGLTVGGGAQNTTIEHSTILGDQVGFSIGQGGTQGLVLANNVIGGRTGIMLGVSASGIIRANDVWGTGNSPTSSSIALDIAAPFSGPIDRNRFHHARIGVVYTTAANLTANQIYDTFIGLTSSVVGVGALGFSGSMEPNEIFDNTIGVYLNGNMQRQKVFRNAIGVQGGGSLVASDLAHANVIESNTTGVDLSGPIRFNRIARNNVGIVAADQQLIANNLIYSNSTGLQISGGTRVDVWNNTFYTERGDNLRVESFSSEIDIRNNVLWTKDGFDIYVSDDSANGIYSDYNLLYASNVGKLVHWAGDYSDILDWQENVHRFDLHSRGATLINPAWAKPRFVNAREDNYEIRNVESALRFSSPTVDAGDPLSDVLTPTGYTNLLTNSGFEQGLAAWTAIPSGKTKGATPSPFSGAQYFDPGPNNTTTLSQTVDLTTPATGQTMAIFGGRVRAANETLRDRGEVSLKFLDASGTVLGTQSAQATNEIDRWELLGGRIAVPAGTRYLRYEYTAIKQTGTNNDAYLDGAFLRIVDSRSAPDLGAFGNASTELPSLASPKLYLRGPDLYRDWERDKLLPILWESYGNDARLPVRIDLYQDTEEGPRMLANISPGAADTGRFDWIPSLNSIDYGTYGLRIQIQLVGDPIAVDRSTESFKVPENTTTYFVNDNSNAGNIYTSTTGDNRNTGKLPTQPKPLPTNILRIYSLGAGSSLMIDPGDYPLPTQLVVSNATDVNDDEGFIFQGDSVNRAILRHANPFTAAPVIDVNDADLMTLANLELRNGQHGVYAHNGTQSLRLRNIGVFGNSLDGVRVDSGSTVDEFDRVRSQGNGRYGAYIDGAATWIHDSTFSENFSTGLYLLNSGNVEVERNSIGRNFGDGIYLTNFGAPATIGAGDLASTRGNFISGNSKNGVFAWGNVNVLGNVVEGHSSSNAAGIFVQGQASASNNVVFSNYAGVIASGNGDLVGNRIYDNATVGIQSSQPNSLRANVVYSNPTGILLTNGFAGTLENNLVYAANEVAILLQAFGSGAKTFKNNTIYQPLGHGIRLEARSSNVTLQNNIIWVQNGSAITVASDSQTGFLSDYNLIYATGAGQTGVWQGVFRTTLDQWRNATQTDANSLSQNPLFVDADGADNVLGYRDPVISGNDDDFHLQSIAGSRHGGALAPTVIPNNGAYSYPQLSSGILTADSSDSPGLNRGAPTDSAALEPAPNGSFVDLGSFGNTAQASLSPAKYLRVISPDGGETWIANQSATIRWRSHDSLDNVTIDLINEAPGQTTVIRVAENVSNSGAYTWLVPANTTPGSNYRVRLTRNGPNSASNTSEQQFAISTPVTVYYVNDSSTLPGDWTTAMGDDNNSGLSPNAPKATIQDVLNDYALGPGSVIRVDAGNYVLATNVVITAADAGVTIEGFFDPAQPEKKTLLNRANQSSSSFAIQFQNADNVAIRRLHITGGAYGIAALNNSDSDGVIITDNRIFQNQNAGIYFEATNDSAVVSGNTIYGAPGEATSTNDQLDGVFLLGNNSLVTSNTVFDGGDIGIEVRGAGSQVTQNQVYNFRVGVRGELSGSVVPIDIVRNTVFNNRDYGIDASGSLVRVRSNQIYSNIGVTGNQGVGAGVRAGSAEIRDNTIYDNISGIEASSASILNNRIYANYNTGIVSTSSIVTGNQIFSNLVGISNVGSSTYEGNVLYNNSANGMTFTGSAGAVSVTNNTVYQDRGNAVRLTSAATNVRLRNNIFHVAGGVGLNVASDSQSGFQSDYNTLFAEDTGQLALWGSQSFNSLADLVYQVGIDTHSQVVDPLLSDPNGADDILGFDRTLVGTPRYFDTVVLTGAWTAANNVSDSYNGDYLTGSTGVGDKYVTWILDGLTPGRTYQLAASTPNSTNYRPFQVFDNGRQLTNLQVSPFASVGKFTEQHGYNNGAIATVAFHPLGFFTPTGTTLEVRMTDKGNGASVQADVIRIQQVVGYGGGDDDLHTRPGSPATDAGDPLSYYLGERQPNGGRVDAGAYGNTPESPLSTTLSVQVLSPNGFEKLEQGQAYPVSIRTSGATIWDTTALINVGGTTIERWLVDRYRTGGTAQSITSAVTTSGVPNPAPAAVYQSYALATQGVGNSLRYQLPVPDGSYSIRLHMVEPNATAANQRKFDIRLQGTTVAANYDLFAATGGNRRASAPSFSVAATNGSGITLDLVNTTTNGAVLSGIELFTTNPNGASNAAVDLDISVNNGQTWLALATGVSVDPSGFANFTWSIPTDQSIGDRYRLRARLATPSGNSDQSDQPFQIVPGGNAFYIHDESTSYEYTTAPGNDANSGKSPDKPMASLAALLAAYDLEPGDVIYVDPGNYNLISNVVIGNQDSGVRIQGPTSGVALFNRGVTASNTNHAFELQNADNVTFDRIHVTGAYYGIYAAASSDSDALTVTNSTIYNNYGAGVYLESSNDDFSISGSVVYGTPGGVSTDNHIFGNLYLAGSNARVSSSRLSGSNANGGSSVGVRVLGTGALIDGSDIFNNVAGIDAAFGAAVTISNNQIYNNSTVGIVGGTKTVTGNTIYGHTGVDQAGIRLAGGGVASNNTIYNNYIGVSLEGGTASANEIYGNVAFGVLVGHSGVLSNNTIRDNPTGVWVNYGVGAPVSIYNNLITNSSVRAFYSLGSGTVDLANNTIYQPTGDGFDLRTGTNLVRLRNNIVVVGSGFAIRDSGDSQVGFTSDYNAYHLTGSAQMALWQGEQISSLGDWRYRVGLDLHSQQVDPQFVSATDRDFRVRDTSPTVDAGDPSFYYLSEPLANGGRINQGHTGNTPLAAPTPTQALQILSPNGFEKIERGETTTISLRSSGITDYHPVALMNVGGGQVENWLGNVYRVDAGSSTRTFSNAVNTTLIDNPAPQTVYQSYAEAQGGVGQKLSYSLPVPNGTYSLRLHFVEPTYSAANQRKFDIRLQGATVQSAYDIFAVAGSQFKAIAATFPVIVANGQGINLDLVNVTSNSAILSGLELTRANLAGVSSPTVALEYSGDSGTTWSTIASHISLDRFGRANHSWNVPADLPLSDRSLVRVSSLQTPTIVDSSDVLFQLADSGTEFYVNDGSTTNDSITSAAGNDQFDGKSPARPMRTLAALLDAYDLNPGDTVHVDAGNYVLLRNITLTNQDSGVRIEGPSSRDAVLNRGFSFLFTAPNGNSGNVDRNAGFELRNADSITLSRLGITGAFNGIAADSSSDSDDLQVLESNVFGNYWTGITLAAGNDRATLSGNLLYGIPGGVSLDNQNRGIEVSGADSVVTRNTVREHTTTGIRTPNALRVQITDNDVFGNQTGIDATDTQGAGSVNRQVVRGNRVHDNTLRGIFAFGNALVSANTVFGHAANNEIGIEIQGGVEASSNTVYGNFIGISSGSDLSVADNRVYNNSSIGIRATNSGPVLRNQIYSNSVGMLLGGSSNVEFVDNLVYANTNTGVLVQATGSGTTRQLLNNTILQSVGNSVRLEGGAVNAVLRNNIIAVQAGTAVSLSTDSQPGFDSNFNLLHVPPSAHVGLWGGSQRTSLTDWRNASSQDSRSVAADPRWVDIDGADNILGYAQVGGVFRDGGQDDNFYLDRLSSGIDAGEPSVRGAFDKEGQPRQDDSAVPNTGVTSYQPVALTQNQFTVSGTAKNWRGDGTSFAYTLPFAFPFYDGTYTSVFVSTEGFLQFVNQTNAGSGSNSTADLAKSRRIAPLWDNLTTNGTGDDIFVDESVTGQVTLRWNATTNDSKDVQFAAVLFSDGWIRFDYGNGTATALSPTVGVSMGNTRAYVTTLGYDGVANVNNKPSVLLTPDGGIFDLGAYEFRGTQADSLAPRVTTSSPETVHENGVTGKRIATVQLVFSEEVSSIDANAPAAYELRSAGANGLFDDSDDATYALAPTYLFGQNTVNLEISTPGGALLPGTYRLTAYGRTNTAIHDLSGLRLDGDNDGVEGGDYVRVFTVRSAGVSVSPLSGLVTTEQGGSASFAVVLDAEPTANVTIPISSSDTTEGATSPFNLVFTPANWSVPQVATITGVDDSILDGDVAYKVVTGPAASQDAAYNGLDPVDVSVTNSDNEIPDTDGPSILDLLDISPDPRQSAVDAIDAVFSEELDLVSLDDSDLALTRDGVQVPLSGLSFARVGTSNTYRVSGLTPFTGTDGVYALSVKPEGVKDLAGNSGQGSSATDSWVKDATPPAAPSALAISPDNGNSATDALTNSGSLTLTGTLGETGLAVRVQNVSTGHDLGSATVNGTSFNIALSLAEGQHELRVIAQDSAGNTSEAALMVVVDLTAPQISSLETPSPNPRTTSVATLDVTLTSPIEPSTFSWQILSLKRNGGTELITSAVTVTKISDTLYRIGGLAALTELRGTYELQIDVRCLTDLAGNLGTGSASSSWQNNRLWSTSTAVSPASASSRFGQEVTLTATVTSPSDDGSKPGGTVTFKDGSTSLATVILGNNGQAVLKTTTLAVGQHSITAEYSGDGASTSSVSAAESYEVNKADSSTALTQSASSTNAGQTVTLTATVTAVAPGSGKPAGNVVFKTGTTVLGTVALNGNGVAQLDVSSLSVGSHTITAEYGGNGNYLSHTSASVIHTVNSAGAVNVSSLVTVTRGGFRLNRATNRYVQTVTLKNTSSQVIEGPISLVLDYLSSNARLYSPSGYTTGQSPLNAPYRSAAAPRLAPNETISLVLEFENPTNAGISYTTRVLAGPGQR